jgi:hypothetical protein
MLSGQPSHEYCDIADTFLSDQDVTDGAQYHGTSSQGDPTKRFH